jgi:DNA-binding NarL/FixJ family response regulator
MRYEWGVVSDSSAFQRPIRHDADESGPPQQHVLKPGDGGAAPNDYEKSKSEESKNLQERRLEAVPSPLHILLVDDRPLARMALKRLFSERFASCIITDTDDLETALRISTLQRPPLVVINYILHKHSALPLAEAIRRDSPESHVLFVSMQESWIALATALKSGIRGFVLESDPTELIIDAMGALQAGYAYFSPPVALLFANAYTNLSHQPTGADLSARELQILERVALGESNKLIAERLQLSIKTVEAHRARMIKKLKLHSTVELVRWAIQERIIPS